jgi:hypothetical protein
MADAFWGLQAFPGLPADAALGEAIFSLTKLRTIVKQKT